MGDIDSEWKPPTEAEMKVIEARRERSEKISKIMGSYLLKGYKMLGELCPVCETILLEDRQEDKYCIGCSEVDSADTARDNPAISAQAARSLEMEELESPSSVGATLISQLNQDRLPHDVSVNGPISERPAATTCVVLPNQEATLTRGGVTCNAGCSVVRLDDASPSRPHILTAIRILSEKIDWASLQLQVCTDLARCTELVKFVQDCSNTMQTLQTTLR